MLMFSPRGGSSGPPSGPPKEEPLTATALREQLNVFATDVLQRELEQLKASISEELSRNKISILAEISQTKTGIVSEMERQAQRNSERRRGSRQRSDDNRPASDVDEHQVCRASNSGTSITESESACGRQDMRPRQDLQPLLDTDAREIDAGGHTGGDSCWDSPGYKKFADFVMSRHFDSVSGFFVLSSVVWLAFVVQYSAEKWLYETPHHFVWMEILFCLVFSAELVIRIMVMGCFDFVCGNSRKSNMFDLSLVVIQVMDTAIEVTHASSGKFALAPFIRVLRLFRVFRLIRIFRVFPDLRMLVVSVIQSFQPLLWVFALVFFLTAVFAIVITVIVNEYKTKVTPEEWEKKDEAEQELQEFFGSLDRTVLTLYGTIAGGRDWHTSAFPLMKFIDERLILVFVLYTFFVIFAMMNVITSQFVDTALEASARDRRETMVNNLMDTFSRGGSSLVSEQDFMNNLKETSMRSFLKDLYKREEVSEEEVKHSRLFEMLDDDDSGAITREELVLGCVRLTGVATSLDLAVLKLDVLETRKDVQQILEKMGGVPKRGPRSRTHSRPESETGSQC